MESNQNTVQKSARTPIPGNKKLVMIIAIVTVALILVLGICCVTSGAAGSIVSTLNQENLEKQAENALPSETPVPTQGVDLTKDKTQTQPIPSDLPAEAKNLILSSWGNPYSVNKSEGEPSQFTLLFSVTNKSADAMISDAKANMSKFKWSTEINEDPDTGAQVLTGNKTVNGKTYTVNIRMLEQQSDIDITFVLNY